MEYEIDIVGVDGLKHCDLKYLVLELVDDLFTILPDWAGRNTVHAIDVHLFDDLSLGPSILVRVGVDHTLDLVVAVLERDDGKLTESLILEADTVIGVKLTYGLHAIIEIHFEDLP